MQVLIKEKQMREVEVTKESYVLCDKCGDKISFANYDAFDFDFSLKTGNSYPEGGSGEKQEMDLCHTCANKLMELLKLNGYRINTSDWDY